MHFVSFGLCFLLLSLVASQYISVQMYNTPTCSDTAYTITTFEADNTCQSYDDGTSLQENCPINKQFTENSCSDQYCEVGCNFTTYSPTQCVFSGEKGLYYSFTCTDDYPLQPVGTYMAKIYNDMNCNNEATMVETDISPLNVCAFSEDGSETYSYFTCDSNYIYQTVCTDNECKKCSTTVVVDPTGCSESVSTSIFYTCILPLPTQPPQSASITLYLPSMLLIIGSIFIFL